MRSKRLEKINSIAKTIWEGCEWTFAGTLTEFVEQWKDNMMVLYVDGKPVVFITDYSNFGQR